MEYICNFHLQNAWFFFQASMCKNIIIPGYNFTQKNAFDATEQQCNPKCHN